MAPHVHLTRCGSCYLGSPHFPWDASLLSQRLRPAIAHLDLFSPCPWPCQEQGPSLHCHAGHQRALLTQDQGCLPPVHASLSESIFASPDAHALHLDPGQPWAHQEGKTLRMLDPCKFWSSWKVGVEQDIIVSGSKNNQREMSLDVHNEENTVLANCSIRTAASTGIVQGIHDVKCFHLRYGKILFLPGRMFALTMQTTPRACRTSLTEAMEAATSDSWGGGLFISHRLTWSSFFLSYPSGGPSSLRPANARFTCFGGMVAVASA